MTIDKKRLLEIYNDNKKVINIALIFLACILVLAIFNKIFDRNSNLDDNPNNLVEEVITITLFGDKVVEIYEGEEYVEPGYYAYTNLGEIKTAEIEVINLVDTEKVGSYTITYILGDKKVTRTVKVLEKEEDEEEEEDEVGNLVFTLNGNSTVIVDQNSEYVEPGYEAFDSTDGDITDKVIVTGSVNTKVAGTYKLTYTIKNSRLEEKTLTRTIIVVADNLELNVEVLSQTYTNKDVTLNILVTGSNFSYVKYPDGTVSTSKNSTYTISSNGIYTIYAYDSNLNYISKTITIKNIDKTAPSGTCTLEYKDGKSNFQVIANDDLSGIKSYDYYGNNALLVNRNANTYSVNSHLTSGYVLIFDKAGNYRKVDCTILNSYDLEVHFINVGREDAIVIRSSEKTIFIDGGSYSKRNTITPYLKNLGISHIDVMIGSHLHYNHIQAQADLLENFTVDKIYYPQDLNTCYSTYCDLADQKYILDAIKKYNKSISIMKVGDNIDIGDMNIYCIGPISFQTKSQNKYRQNYNSLNFILTYGTTKFMFTGDYMQYSNILKKFSKNILDVDVLKYPHHGNASLGKELVNAMSPKYVVLTSSRDELSSRSEKTYLTNIGASFYYSYKDGNILIQSDGNKITVKTNVDPSDYRR